jgi:hypothetical protein
MAKPLYVAAFEHFKRSNEDPLKAMVAFGLFVEAEHKWASSQQVWPTEAKYRHYHDCSLPHTAANYANGADIVLLEFANEIVEQKREEFLAEALEAYRNKAAESHHSFWKGVAEAATGALAWSLALILASIIFHRLGIDVLEAYEKAAGPKIQHSAPASEHSPQR